MPMLISRPHQSAARNNMWYVSLPALWLQPKLPQNFHFWWACKTFSNLPHYIFHRYWQSWSSFQFSWVQVPKGAFHQYLHFCLVSWAWHLWQSRYHSRFFTQVGHETTYVSKVWDIPCIARVMVRITLSGGVSNVSQRKPLVVKNYSILTAEAH